MNKLQTPCFMWHVFSSLSMELTHMVVIRGIMGSMHAKKSVGIAC